MKYTPTANSYFAGAAGMDLGMIRAGIEVKQSLDLDPDAIEVLNLNRAHFPTSHKVLHRDIKDITVLSQDGSDIIIGTYPCTKYSAIADIHGTRTGDDLFLHFFRHVALHSPEAYVV
jgi:DNA (cytosine-5)-methyltransferase 1